MARITLSIPDNLYKLMRKYKEINWSEIARRAIVRKILSLKACDEGLSREEFSLLLEIMGETGEVKQYPIEEELHFLKLIRERERKRMEFLKELERK